MTQTPADDTPAATPAAPSTGMGSREAAALVFGTSGAVLVVELVALRLLAPYLGLTLETNTLVIGTALVAIALGSWWGGWLADRVPPRRTIAPALAASGAVVAAMPFLVRSVGAVGDPGLTLLVAAVAIIAPATLLSAIPPMVVKLRLSTLAETGTVVGRLSGLGTVGAVAGTVLTGFVLISLVPVSAILVGLGVLLVVASVPVGVGARRWRHAGQALGVAVLAGLATTVGPGGCDVETSYHCARVVTDPERETGRVLVLDNLRHSYVDTADPTHLEFAYVRAIAATVDAAFPGEEALDAHHVGGGGLTVPRWLATTRPGTTSTVSEIDAGVVDVDRELLGVETGPELQVRVEDGRVGLERLPAAELDLVVGDAFGGVSVPWHLTTREALTGIHRVLADDGVYVVNLIDQPPLAFARAEVATARTVFDHVVVMAAPPALTGDDGGNIVVAASDRPLDLAAIRSGLDERGTGWDVLDDADLGAWVGDADVLTDDHAPVDQLLTVTAP